MPSCLFSIVWPLIQCSLQLFNLTESTTTVVQGKLKYRHIICMHVMYVTISIRYGCMFLT